MRGKEESCKYPLIRANWHVFYLKKNRASSYLYAFAITKSFFNKVFDCKLDKYTSCIQKITQKVLDNHWDSLCLPKSLLSRNSVKRINGFQCQQRGNSVFGVYTAQGSLPVQAFTPY